MAKKRNLFRRSRKLVTLGSLRLGLELLGRENCIGFHPILLGCKVRNPQNLAGSAPQTPTSANILIQKKEQKFMLLESVIPAGLATALQMVASLNAFPLESLDINKHHW
jgi:hypothetical protein